MAKSNNTQKASAGKKKKPKGKGGSKKYIDPLVNPVPRGLAPRAPRVLADIVVVNALPPEPGLPPNLMKTIVAQTEGLKLQVSEWDDAFPSPAFNPDEYQLYMNGIPYGNRIIRPKPLADLMWPLEIVVDPDSVSNHGDYRLTGEVFLGQGGNEQSGTTVVTVDTVGPVGTVKLEAMKLLGAVDGKVTRESMAANGNKLTFIVPGRLIPRPKDSLSIFRDITDSEPIVKLNDLPVNTLEQQVSVTADEAIALGEGDVHAFFIYSDYSDNSSLQPKLTPITFVFTPQPGNLSDPAVPEAPLDLRDAQLKLAEVFIFGYDNFKSGQTILIKLGTEMFPYILTIEPTATNPAKIEIPWGILSKVYGITAPGTADLSYQVVEGGVASAPSNAISVAADFSSAAGDPDDPGPIRDYLPKIMVESSEGLINEIGPGDNGDATARFNVYMGAAAGHKLQLYWGGIPIFITPHSVTQAEIDSGQFVFTIPATTIAAGGNEQDKPVWYSVTNGVNPNMDTSQATLVDVFASELTNLAPAQFPKSVGADSGVRSISCKQFVELGIDTRIKDAVNLKAGDTIRRFWTLYGEGLTSTNILVDAEILPAIVVTNDHSLPGHNGEEFIADFDTYVKPAILGRIEFYYTVLKADGVTKGEALPTILYLSRRNADNSICGAPPTP